PDMFLVIRARIGAAALRRIAVVRVASNVRAQAAEDHRVQYSNLVDLRRRRLPQNARSTDMYPASGVTTAAPGGPRSWNLAPFIKSRTWMMKAVAKLSALAMFALAACLPKDNGSPPAGGGASGSAAPDGGGTTSGGATGGGGQSTGGSVSTGTAGGSGGAA